ncbi:hypothetical protein MASR2M78_08480 [Treponema sp.]
MGSKSTVYLAYLMAASACWAGFYALAYIVDSFILKLIIANPQYFAISSIPVFWYSFGMSYNREEWSGTGR